MSEYLVEYYVPTIAVKYPKELSSWIVDHGGGCYWYPHQTEQPEVPEQQKRPSKLSLTLDAASPKRRLPEHGSADSQTQRIAHEQELVPDCF